MVTRKKFSKMSPLVNQNKIKLLKQFIKKGPTTDIGCGNGLYGFWLHCQDFDVLQVDILDRRAAQARVIPFKLMDVEENEFGDADSLTNILAFDVIEHLDRDVVFIEKTYRYLNKEGRIFISVPNKDNSALSSMELAHIHFTDKTHRREYSPEDITNLLKSNGFKNIVVVPQYNSSVVCMPLVLSQHSLLSRFFAKFLVRILALFLVLRIFKNPVISDWLVTAEK